MKKKKILIIGGTGFIGYHLAAKCKKLNWRNTWNMKISIRETAQWYKCFLNKEDIKKFTIYQINNYFNIK